MVTAFPYIYAHANRNPSIYKKEQKYLSGYRTKSDGWYEPGIATPDFAGW